MSHPMITASLLRTLALLRSLNWGLTLPAGLQGSVKVVPTAGGRGEVGGGDRDHVPLCRKAGFV
jgi:hypothetical protein